MKTNKIFSLVVCLAMTSSSAVFAENELKAMLEFYTSQSVWTDPGKYRSLYDGLPEGIEGAVKTVQNVLVHGGLVWLYDFQPSALQRGGQDIRRTEELLEMISRLDNRPLREERSRSGRLLVNCRQFAVLTCSILRQRGVPARVRAGYGLYLGGVPYENHWICEYWSEKGHRWIQVDAQIDNAQRKLMGINFNSLDMPEGKFVPAGEGWRRYRDGEVPIGFFGVSGNSFGWSMVMPNVVCDAMAVNKDELLPWDTSPYWNKKESEMSTDDMEVIENLAAWNWDTAAEWQKGRAFYDGRPNLHMPKDFEKKTE